ncbi:unnamed protein product [Adineta ricciae]|uniref:Uncharacterized protein n=1 Tax=Adineta ricciae TaxID=249248 RepID=A0A813YU79_ADIRI|nr:unnamed protein product [Adineta ricciae]CAF1433534.1 unnamed protein product [Adineta ricciae]
MNIPHQQYFEEHLEKDYHLLSQTCTDREQCYIWLYKLINHMLMPTLTRFGRLDTQTKVIDIEQIIEQNVIFPHIVSFTDEINEYRVNYVKMSNFIRNFLFLIRYQLDLKEVQAGCQRPSTDRPTTVANFARDTSLALLLINTSKDATSLLVIAYLHTLNIEMTFKKFEFSAENTSLITQIRQQSLTVKDQEKWKKTMNHNEIVHSIGSLDYIFTYLCNAEENEIRNEIAFDNVLRNYVKPELRDAKWPEETNFDQFAAQTHVCHLKYKVIDFYTNMFGGYGGFPGNNNPFAGGFGELASDWAINQFVPGGLNGPMGRTADYMIGGNPNGGFGFGGGFNGGYGMGYGYF